jgi:hypothetical protein
MWWCGSQASSASCGEAKRQLAANRNSRLPYKPYHCMKVQIYITSKRVKFIVKSEFSFEVAQSTNETKSDKFMTKTATGVSAIFNSSFLRMLKTTHTNQHSNNDTISAGFSIKQTK